jgi:hypothetical protein
MEEQANQGTDSQNKEIALKKSKKKVLVLMLVLVAVLAALSAYVYVQGLPPPPGLYTAFAKCIASTPTKFYGAWWCPHCRNQKNEFGDAAQYLPYVECSTPDASGQTQICIDAGIKNYPTWVFPDGSRLTGEVPLATLAQKTSCTLPTSTRS